MLTISELKSELREYKLKIINDETKFEVDPTKFSGNKMIKFIKKEFSEDVITGSVALSLFGLLGRYTNDIDILIKNKNRYSYYDYFCGYGDADIPNRLGYKNFKYKPSIFSITKEYRVDFFEDIGSSFIEYDGVKIQHPIEIINYKMLLANSGDTSSCYKHRNDLMKIFG